MKAKQNHWGGKVALLQGTSAGEVDGLTEGTCGAQGLVDDAQGTIDEGRKAYLVSRRSQSSMAAWYMFLRGRWAERGCL